MMNIVKPFSFVEVAVGVAVYPVAITFAFLKVARVLRAVVEGFKQAFAMHPVFEKITFVQSQGVLIDLPASAVELAALGCPCFKEALLSFPHE